MECKFNPMRYIFETVPYVCCYYFFVFLSRHFFYIISFAHCFFCFFTCYVNWCNFYAIVFVFLLMLYIFWLLFVRRFNYILRRKQQVIVILSVFADIHVIYIEKVATSEHLFGNCLSHFGCIFASGFDMQIDRMIHSIRNTTELNTSEINVKQPRKKNVCDD